MSIPGVCPDCGCKGPLHLFMHDANARKALLGALRASPQLADRIISYIGLFSPGKRAITMKKLADILDSLTTQIGAASVDRNGVTYAAPIEYWAQAFDQISANRENLELPLKTHGYLFAIVAGIAKKSAIAAERKQEDRLRFPTERQPSEFVSFSDLTRKTKKQSQKKRPPPATWCNDPNVRKLKQRKNRNEPDD